jgi:hypothetical protein
MIEVTFNPALLEELSKFIAIDEKKELEDKLNFEQKSGVDNIPNSENLNNEVDNKGIVSEEKKPEQAEKKRSKSADKKKGGKKDKKESSKEEEELKKMEEERLEKERIEKEKREKELFLKNEEERKKQKEVEEEEKNKLNSLYMKEKVIFSSFNAPSLIDASITPSKFSTDNQPSSINSNSVSSLIDNISSTLGGIPLSLEDLFYHHKELIKTVGNTLFPTEQFNFSKIVLFIC